MKTQAAPVSEGWIFDEDRALRDLLDDIKVSDSGRNNRRVGVWFGIPDQELRQQSYPTSPSTCWTSRWKPTGLSEGGVRFP